MASKQRIDLLLVERGLAESRALAQRLVMAGRVRVQGQTISKPSQRVDSTLEIDLDRGPPFVSRGGEKLEHALAAFSIDVGTKVCADVGASTGGFTDCLLQRGAARVYALDVGHGVLHWRLRQDPRVVVMEGVNVRYQHSLPEPIDLVVIDAAFISLELLLPVVHGWLRQDGELIALVKPQFEAGREAVGKKGVVRDPDVHRQVVEKIWKALSALGMTPQGAVRSPLTGPKGNVEFLLWATMGGAIEPNRDLLSRLFDPAAG